MTDANQSGCHTQNEPSTSACHEHTATSEQAHTSSCCPSERKQFDWLLWGSLSLTILFCLLSLTPLEHTDWLGIISHSVRELIGVMWWSVLLAILFVGVLSKVPQDFIISILGKVLHLSPDGFIILLS